MRRTRRPAQSLSPVPSEPADRAVNGGSERTARGYRREPLSSPQFPANHATAPGTALVRDGSRRKPRQLRVVLPITLMDPPSCWPCAWRMLLLQMFPRVS